MKRFLLVSMSIAIFAACAGSPKQSTDSAGGADRAQFTPVSGMLLRRCGSLDCHGRIYRNFRLVGVGGRRLDDKYYPDGPATTEDEIDHNFQAILGIEPEIMRTVIAEGGANPQRLTVVRKGRGSEDHKGGQRIGLGDDADICLTSWLASDVDSDACARATTQRLP